MTATVSLPTYRTRVQSFDYYAELAFDRMGERLAEARDRAVRHWESFHRERAGQLTLPGLLPFSTDDDPFGALFPAAPSEPREEKT